MPDPCVPAFLVFNPAMLRIAAVRGLRGLRPFSTAPPLREPGVVGLTAGPDPRKVSMSRANSE